MVKKVEQYQDKIARLFPSQYTRGEEKNLARTITIQCTDDCNLKCTYCMMPDTLITMSDLSQKKIIDVKIGDKILAFPEYSQNKWTRPFVQEAIVEQLHKSEAKEILNITFSDKTSIEITPEHKVLVKNYTTRHSDCYRKANELKVGDRVYSFKPFPKQIEKDIAIERKKKNILENVFSCVKKKEIISIEKNIISQSVYNLGTSTRTYIANGTLVHNCYQINKGSHAISAEKAKKFIDLMLEADEDSNEYINPSNSPAVVLEFIGGEPFLEIDLIDELTDYFINRLIELKHPWATRFMISICSNGVLYFEPKVQAYLKKHMSHLSFSISIDGNKELHDSCRVFPDGSGSYDIAIAGVKHFTEVLGGYMGSKMTLAPENIVFLYDAVRSLIENGYKEINLNCVYEKGWNAEHATIMYYQLKTLADYLLKNDLDDKIYLSIFEEDYFKPKAETEIDNWCFKAGTMILTPDGNKPIEALKIGDMIIGSDGLPHKISNTTKRMAKDTVSIVATNMSKTFTTKNHPYLTKKISHINSNNVYNYKNPEWINVLNINKGDKIALYQEKFDNYIWVDVTSVSDEEPYEVYNITVKDVHTYIANGAIVHNCGGTGFMIAVDWKGDIFPCIRYMESSLGEDIKPLIIGNVDGGVMFNQEQIDCVNRLKKVDRRTQSTDECFFCPIADGCSWCSAYHYQEFGTVDKRATYICIMHKARALANAYYWNKVYEKQNKDKKFKCNVPKEWALEIINETEYNKLMNMSKKKESDGK